MPNPKNMYEEGVHSMFLQLARQTNTTSTLQPSTAHHHNEGSYAPIFLNCCGVIPVCCLK